MFSSPPSSLLSLIITSNLVLLLAGLLFLTITTRTSSNSNLVSASPHRHQQQEEKNMELENQQPGDDYDDDDDGFHSDHAREIHNRNNDPSHQAVLKQFQKKMAEDEHEFQNKLNKRWQEYKKNIREHPEHPYPELEYRSLTDPVYVMNNKTAENCKMHCPRCHRWSKMGERCIAFNKYPSREEMDDCIFHFFHPTALQIDPIKWELINIVKNRMDSQAIPASQKKLFILAGDNGVGKTHLTHVMSLLGSQYYFRESDGSVDYNRGDAILEFECGTIGHFDMQEKFDHILGNLQPFAEDHPRGVVVFNDLQFCPKEVIDGILIPLFQPTGKTGIWGAQSPDKQIRARTDPLPKTMTIFVTMDMGKVAATQDLTLNELRDAVTKRVVNEFGWELERVSTIFPMESWDKRVIYWTLKTLLDQLPCRLGHRIDKVSYTVYALEWFTNAIVTGKGGGTRTKISNGRKVADYFSANIEVQASQALRDFRQQQQSINQLNYEEGTGPGLFGSALSYLMPRKQVVLTIYYLPPNMKKDEPEFRVFLE